MTKAKPKTKAKLQSAPTVRMLQAALLDIEDEIYDLTEALGYLSELRMMSSTMRDIIEPPRRDRVPGSADRIGQCSLKLFGKQLDKHISDTGKAFIKRAYMVSPTDISEVAQMIPDAVRWRLYRIAALIRLLKE